MTVRLTLALFALTLTAFAASQPNVVLILADDQGWTGTSVTMDPRVPGSRSDYYRTPALERLASEGMRFSNAYGPYSFRKGSVIAAFFRRAISGEPLLIYGDGDQTRDFIHTDDLCQAMIKAADKDVGGEVFQIATGRETTVNELAQNVKALVERDTDRKVEIIHEPARDGEIFRNYSDIGKARKMLGFEPGVELTKGLEQTWEWFQKKMSRP